MFEDSSYRFSRGLLGGRGSRAAIQAGLFRPIFPILEINVVGFTPKSSAAPSIPLIFQPVFSRTAKRFSRSRRCISESVRYSESDLSPSRGVTGVGSGEESTVGRSNSKAPP